jgi:hypothetical protein
MNSTSSRVVVFLAATLAVLATVDKSRYVNPPRWLASAPKNTRARVFLRHKLQRVIAAAMPYVLVAAIVCALVALHADQRLVQ